ncbi:PREDICTED: dystroglycan-like [Pseudopodoces humilis]|uniref:dystroglycan-like n=1 Tax=Pseudopodoces humilis TaxID=181119 RepID=UPI0006B70FF9|nr:PREDICTED: dystroglycan-like [Pseudopodoces humilis]
MEDDCRDPGHAQHSSPASGSPVLPGLGILPLLPLLFAPLSVCVSSPAEVAKALNNRCEETKSPQGIIPDATVLMGKIFYYPVPAFAFQGRITQYKVTLASGADLPKWLEFSPKTNMLQGLPMAGEGGAYLLNLAASGGDPDQETLRAAGNFTIHVKDSSLSLEMQSLKHMPNSYRCGKEAPITYAEIILSAGAAALEVRERLSVVCRMAEYLHLDSSLLTLLQHTGPAARGSHVLAEDTGHINLNTNHYVGLSWPVTCGGFALLREFIQVLQHNMNSHHLSQLLGYEIAGWRILRRGEYERKSPRLHRRQLMITPTPALKPTRIIQRPAAGEASRPLFFPVPSQLLTPLVLSPTQSLSTFCAESITMASYKMQNDIHLVSQESLVTLEMDSAQDMPTNPTVPIMFADSHFPDLSPSLMTKTRLLFSELEVLPARASGTWLMLEQPESPMPEVDSYFLSSKSEISTYHLLEDITSGTEQLSRPWVINTIQEWPHSSAVEFSPKTELHPFLPESMSVSEVPDYSNEAESHFSELEKFSDATLCPEALPSLFQEASVRATTLSGFISPIKDTFPAVLASSSLSQVFTNGCEPQSKPSMTIPQPSGFSFDGGKSTASSVAQREAQTLYSKLIFSAEASSASFPHTLTSPVPGKTEAPHEPSLITLSHADTTPVLTVLEDFSAFHMSRLSRPANTFPPYSSSMLRTEAQPTRILPSGTEELLSDKDLDTSGILPNVTEPTLESHSISGIKPDAVEAPLVTLFNATSHLPSSIPKVGETLLPSHLDPSTRLFPSSERLHFVESGWILPPFSASQELQTVTQGQANTSPKVVHSIKFLTATIGCLFFFPIPANTFYDKEDGNSTQLSLEILPADGSLSGSTSWLQFNSSQQAMHGYPLEMDFQYSPQEFVLSATDSGGLTAWQSFTIELLKPSELPCHLFTVRTKNSYSSFLRERKRVGLFLEKLSLFLNSRSRKDIVLTALQPGSTLISWYNSSLCVSANRSSSWCGKDEIQQALEKLRVPAGSVSPQFVQAMLPEYRIDVTFGISYTEDCPASTKPFLRPCSSTGPTLQAKNDSKMRSPRALLSSVFATAGVGLAIVVCWLCRCPRRIPGAQPVMLQTNSQLSHTNVELDALRPRKVPVHECRASLSPPLWIPPSGPLPSHEQSARTIPHIVTPIQPPKYRLPPHYPDALTTHHNQGNIQRLKS